MSKNFSVAWLSLSSQLDRRTDLNAALERSPAPPALQTKHPSQNGVLLSDDNVKDLSNSPSSPTDSSGYISGSESEVGDDSEEESAPNRRIRTKFTSYQIARLEKTFHRHKYLGANRRRKLAEKLHLSETQVKTWFQNRRMKLKREAQDARVEYYTHALLAPLILSPPPLQHHPLAGQPLAFLRCFPQVNRMVSVQQHTPSLPMIHPLLPMLTLCSSPL